MGIMLPWTETVPIRSLALPATVQFHRSELDAGLIEALCATSAFYEVLPFQQVDGDVGETYYDNCKNDVSEISSAAKKLGRSYMRDVAKTLGMHQPISVNNERVSFKMLNFLLAQVKSPDFFMAHHAFMRSMYSLHRAHGTDWGISLELPSGKVVPRYRGIPIFRNDFLSGQEIIVGRFDDGTAELGVAGLIPDQGFIGATRILSGWHLAFTGGLAVFDDDAVASLTNVEPY